MRVADIICSQDRDQFRQRLAEAPDSVVFVYDAGTEADGSPSATLLLFMERLQAHGARPRFVHGGLRAIEATGCGEVIVQSSPQQALLNVVSTEFAHPLHVIMPCYSSHACVARLADFGSNICP